MADSRLGAPEGKAEQANGDGAAAFLLGNENVIAEIEASASLTREYLDTWRAPGERFAHSWEERFALTQAYDPLFKKIIHDVLEKAKVAPGDLGEDRARRAQSARRRRDRSRELKLDPAKVRRLVRADGRTDRRRACGADADRGAAGGASPAIGSWSRRSPTAPTRWCCG